jgi:hypothetical protein
MMTVRCIQKWNVINVIYIQNDACSLPKRVDKWRYFKYLLTRQQMVIHLFFALTMSIRSWVLFPTLSGSINTKSMVYHLSPLPLTEPLFANGTMRRKFFLSFDGYNFKGLNTFTASSRKSLNYKWHYVSRSQSIIWKIYENSPGVSAALKVLKDKSWLFRRAEKLKMLKNYT